MLGFFLNCDEVNFDDLIFAGEKVIETRNKNTLQQLEYMEGVAIIKTGKGKKPVVVGTVDIGRWYFSNDFYGYLNYDLKLACIPENSTFYVSRGKRYGEKGKYCYELENPVKFDTPIELSKYHVIRHGRSYCELYV